MTIIDDMWDADEAAAHTGKSASTINWYVRTGQLVPDGSYQRRHLFKPETVTAFFADRKAGAPRKVDKRRKENR